MSLLDILAGAEKSQHSRLGRWRQKVSIALDTIGASRNPDGIEASKNSVQNGVTTGTDVVLEDLRFNSGDVAYDTSTGIVSLVPGRTYRLSASLYCINFSDAANGEIIVNWVDANTNVILSACTPGVFHPMTYSFGPNSQKPVIDAIFRANLFTNRVKLRVSTSVGGGTVSVSTASGLYVTEIR